MISIEAIKNYTYQIKQQEEAVAKVRDQLDVAISEMESLRENCNEAWYHLQDARDALSQLV